MRVTCGLTSGWAGRFSRLSSTDLKGASFEFRTTPLVRFYGSRFSKLFSSALPFLAVTLQIRMLSS